MTDIISDGESKHKSRPRIATHREPAQTSQSTTRHRPSVSVVTKPKKVISTPPEKQSVPMATPQSGSKTEPKESTSDLVVPARRPQPVVRSFSWLVVGSSTLVAVGMAIGMLGVVVTEEVAIAGHRSSWEFSFTALRSLLSSLF